MTAKDFEDKLKDGSMFGTDLFDVTREGPTKALGYTWYVTFNAADTGFHGLAD